MYICMYVGFEALQGEVSIYGNINIYSMIVNPSSFLNSGGFIFQLYGILILYGKILLESVKILFSFQGCQALKQTTMTKGIVVPCAFAVVPFAKFNTNSTFPH